MIIRPATEDNLPGILEIYNHVIATSTAIYDNDPVTLESRILWFEAQKRDNFPVFVALENDTPIGFASYGAFRSKPCYSKTVEHTVHVADEAQGKGTGLSLMSVLLDHAKSSGVHTMIGVIDADNSGSIKFHERLGFEKTGHLREVGFKFGRWLDAVLMQTYF